MSPKYKIRKQQLVSTVTYSFLPAVVGTWDLFDYFAMYFFGWLCFLTGFPMAPHDFSASGWTRTPAAAKAPCVASAAVVRGPRAQAKMLRAALLKGTQTSPISPAQTQKPLGKTQKKTNTHTHTHTRFLEVCQQNSLPEWMSQKTPNCLFTTKTATKLQTPKSGSTPATQSKEAIFPRHPLSHKKKAKQNLRLPWRANFSGTLGRRKQSSKHQ